MINSNQWWEIQHHKDELHWINIQLISIKNRFHRANYIIKSMHLKANKQTNKKMLIHSSRKVFNVWNKKMRKNSHFPNTLVMHFWKFCEFIIENIFFIFPSTHIFWLFYIFFFPTSGRTFLFILSRMLRIWFYGFFWDAFIIIAVCKFFIFLMIFLGKIFGNIFVNLIEFHSFCILTLMSSLVYSDILNDTLSFKKPKNVTSDQH